MKKNNFSRRDFIKKSVIAGGGILGANTLPGNNQVSISNNNDSLPREVWVSTISQEGLRANDPMDMVKKIIDILDDNVKSYHPDVICLPEIFPFVNNEKPASSRKEKADISSDVLKRFSAYAAKNNCYIICPVYTTEKKKIYNSAVVIDRKGKRTGEYRKIYTTDEETIEGVTPGEKEPAVFKTDFGTIGVQICYDIMWDDSWKQLSEKGVEIIFWPSAFAGGRMVNVKAWQCMSYVVSSSWKNTSKICDVTGDVITETGIYGKNIVTAPLNLEKAFLHTWPAFMVFEKIKNKYGRKVRITNYHEEEWSIIESLSPDLKVSDILKEFKLITKRQMLLESEKVQNRAR